MLPYPHHTAYVSGPFHGQPVGGATGQRLPPTPSFQPRGPGPGWMLSQDWKPTLNNRTGEPGGHNSKAGPTHKAKQVGSRLGTGSSGRKACGHPGPGQPGWGS